MGETANRTVGDTGRELHPWRLSQGEACSQHRAEGEERSLWTRSGLPSYGSRISGKGTALVTSSSFLKPSGSSGLKSSCSHRGNLLKIQLPNLICFTKAFKKFLEASKLFFHIKKSIVSCRFLSAQREAEGKGLFEGLALSVLKEGKKRGHFLSFRSSKARE